MMNDLPDAVDECVCGHFIQQNCYITDGKQILVLGNCCIKKFNPKSSRTCEDCGNPHKNRKVNKCNKRTGGTCEICGAKYDKEYWKCIGCW